MAFSGKVALVTGAGSGMGRIAAKRLAQAGAKVAAVDLNEAGLAETANGSDAFTILPCDVSNREQVDELVAKVEKDLGPIDRVTHAAGIMPTGPVLDMEADTFAKLMRVNYEGTVYVTKATLPAMVERKKGDLILFGSMAGNVLAREFAAYSATKAAVNAFGEILAREVEGTGVRVLLACPPMTKTPLIDQAQKTRSVQIGLERNRLADPEKIIEGIEQALEDGVTEYYPAGEAKALWRMRRFTPKLLWWIISKAENA